MRSLQLRFCAGLLAWIMPGFVVGGPAVAQNDYRGTQQQQFACTPDVFRLCGREIPDVPRIVACLKANQLRLSPGCRAAFAPDPRRPRPDVAPPRDRRDYDQHYYDHREYNREPRDDNGGYDRDDDY